MADDLDETIRRAENSLDRHLAWISRYDNRSAFLIGIELAMLGHFVTILPQDTPIGPLLGVMIAIFLFLKALSFGVAFWGNFPNVNARNDSLLFFQTIAARKVDQFVRDTKGQSFEEHLNDVLQQIHINASILQKKFRSLKIGMIVMLLSIVPWISVIYLTNSI